MTPEELKILAEAAKEGAFRAALIAQKPWLNIREAAQYLGVSEDLIYKAVESGRLECSYAKANDNTRGRILVSRESLNRFPQKHPGEVKVRQLFKAKKNDLSANPVEKILRDIRTGN